MFYYLLLCFTAFYCVLLYKSVLARDLDRTNANEHEYGLVRSTSNKQKPLRLSEWSYESLFADNILRIASRSIVIGRTDVYSFVGAALRGLIR